jgi:hypothetical protein
MKTVTMIICSPSLNDDIGCGAYKVGYAVGWNAAGALYGRQDNSRDYEEPGEYYNDYDENGTIGDIRASTQYVVLVRP